MSSRPAKIQDKKDESILLDSFGNVAWDLKIISKKTGRQVIIGDGLYGRRVLRDMMNKYNLHFPNSKE